MAQEYTSLQVALDFDRLARSLGYELEYDHNYDLFVHRLPQKRDHALDVGCGAGGLMRQLAPYFRSVTGIDLSSEMIDLARKASRRHFLQHLNWTLADVMSTPFASESFDYIVSYTCLHHVPDLTVALKEIRRLLRPGGRTVLLDCVQFLPRCAGSRSIFGSGLKAMSRNLCEVIGYKELPYNVCHDSDIHWEADPVWIEHLRRDRFLYAWRFSSSYRAVLPDAETCRVGMYRVAIWERSA